MPPLSPPLGTPDSVSYVHVRYIFHRIEGTYVYILLYINTHYLSVRLFIGQHNSLGSDSDSSSNGAAVTTAVLTIIITLTATVVVASIVAYFCVKKKHKKTLDLSNQLPQEMVLYEQISLPSHTVSKNNVELQPNPAYGTSYKIVMDSNPAHAS